MATSERHRKIIEDGLRLMPELTCASATRVVYVDDARYLSEDGWVLAGSPDLVFLNYASHLTVAKATQAFLHESTHTADQLLNSQREQAGILDGLIGENFYPKGEASADAWPAATRTKARQVVDNNRLRGGYRAEWVRIHRNFQAFGLASDYAIAGQASGVEPASAGFTSDYGRSAIGEDIAEFAGWMLAAPLFDEESTDL